MIPQDRSDWLRFTLVPGISRAAQRTLLRAFGSPGGALEAPVSEVARHLGPEAMPSWKRGPDPATLERALRWTQSGAGCLVALGDPEYPEALLQTADPPSVLYVRGRLELLNAPTIALVGSRNATPAGCRDARELACALSDSGLTVASGLALGIDAAAHRGGLAGASSSVAVMGTGPETFYPDAHRELGARLAVEGAVVTEFAPGTPPRAENFPCRNRILSGLARGVLVVEAALGSGSLITARCALEQGREVFAVPGSIHAPLSRGCHHLIRQGATLVESIADVLRELGMAQVDRQPKRAPPAEPDPLLEAMGFAAASIDQLCLRTGRSAAQLSARLAELEIAGRIEALPGGRFQRNPHA
jgi:DNA processing protein